MEFSIEAERELYLVVQVIQVDIGGHPPIPLGPPPLLLSIFQFP